MQGVFVKNKREFCISAIRKILQDKRIQYKEIEANTGSVYFRLLLGTSSPCLRLADHHHGRKRPSMTIYWMVGENAKERNIRNRIELLINKMIKNSRIGKTLAMLDDIGVKNA